MFLQSLKTELSEWYTVMKDLWSSALAQLLHTFENGSLREIGLKEDPWAIFSLLEQPNHKWTVRLKRVVTKKECNSNTLYSILWSRFFEISWTLIRCHSLNEHITSNFKIYSILKSNPSLTLLLILTYLSLPKKINPINLKIWRKNFWQNGVVNICILHSSCNKILQVVFQKLVSAIWQRTIHKCTVDAQRIIKKD